MTRRRGAVDSEIARDVERARAQLVVSPLLAELVAIREQIEELRADVGVIGERVLAEPIRTPGPGDRELTDEETRPTPKWGSG